MKDNERHGEAFEGDIRLTVIGERLHPGDAAPDFSLDLLNPGDAMPHAVTLADGAGRVPPGARSDFSGVHD